MCMLCTEDFSSISRTRQGLQAAGEDVYLWKRLHHRHFPATSLHPPSLEDRKHVFLLHQNNIIESLYFFQMNPTFEEDVLDFPISITVNPGTHDVDYIQVRLDILAREAISSGVRNAADNQKFKLLPPLYIMQECFERCLPIVGLCTLGREMSKVFSRDGLGRLAQGIQHRGGFAVGQGSGHQRAGY